MRDMGAWAMREDGSSRYEWKYVKKKMHICHKTVSKSDVETIDLMKLNFKC